MDQTFSNTASVTTTKNYDKTTATFNGIQVVNSNDDYYDDDQNLINSEYPESSVTFSRQVHALFIKGTVVLTRSWAWTLIRAFVVPIIYILYMVSELIAIIIIII